MLGHEYIGFSTLVVANKGVLSLEVQRKVVNSICVATVFHLLDMDEPKHGIELIALSTSALIVKRKEFLCLEIVQYLFPK